MSRQAHTAPRCHRVRGWLAVCWVAGALGVFEPSIGQVAELASGGQVLLLDDGKDHRAFTINTRADERDPALTRDGHLLFFASDRGGSYLLYAVYLEGLTAEGIASTIPGGTRRRGLPSIPGLGGPGEERSPAVCEAGSSGDSYSIELFYRSEADWGAGLYRAEITATVVRGDEARLLVSSGRVWPVLQDVGLRLDGPWMMQTPSGQVLLARAEGKFVGWRLRECNPEPLSQPELLEALPWLSEPGAGLSFASRGPSEVLASVETPHGHRDLRWIDARAVPELPNTDWDELEAAWGMRQEGKQLLIFSRESSPTRSDGNLLAIWVPIPDKAP